MRAKTIAIAVLKSFGKSLLNLALGAIIVAELFLAAVVLNAGVLSTTLHWVLYVAYVILCLQTMSMIGNEVREAILRTIKQLRRKK